MANDHNWRNVDAMVRRLGNAEQRPPRGTSNARARAEREEVERTLRELYDLREQMEPSVQQMLCKEVSDHFAKPLWGYNKNWLAIHGALVKKSIKRAKKKATIQGVRSIKQYFKPR